MSSINRVRKLQELYFSRKNKEIKKLKKLRKIVGPEPAFIHTTCIVTTTNFITPCVIVIIIKVSTWDLNMSKCSSFLWLFCYFED